MEKHFTTKALCSRAGACQPGPLVPLDSVAVESTQILPVAQNI